MKINNRPVILFCLILLKVLFSFKDIYAQAPQITSFTPDSGSVGSLITITGTDLGNTTAFSIGGVSALVISNSGTTLVGMVMPGAVTGLVSVNTVGGSATSSINFIVTSTPFPGMQQGNKLVGGGLVGAGEQGYSVSISADGNTAIVGGYKDNSDQGAVWIYTRTGGFWNQQGSKLVGTGNIGAARQGVSVSISADGNTAIAGGLGDNSNQGAAWIWTRTGTLWTQQGVKLVGSGNTGAAQQGTSVSISADGNTVIVGGFADNGNVGAAWVWKRNGGNWTQEGGKLVGSGYVGSSNQGRSVCLSDDGNTAIVGGPNDNFPNGAAWIWIRTGGTWLQQGNKLVGTGGVGIQVQGRSVSISADGNVVIVGGPGDNLNIGAAWVWLRTGGVWLQLGNKLVGSGGIGGQSQGFSVSISADGSTAIVGGSADNGSIGAAWVWKRNGSSWAQQGNKLIGTGNSGISYQGTSVDLSADASTVIIGGRGDNSLQGAAWIFIPLSPPTITTITPDSGAVGTLVTISGTNLINPSSLTIGGVPAIVISNTGTSIVAMAMPGTVTGLVSIANCRRNCNK